MLISLPTKRISAISLGKTFIRVLPTRWRRKPVGIEISLSPYVYMSVPHHVNSVEAECLRFSTETVQPSGCYGPYNACTAAPYITSHSKANVDINIHLGPVLPLGGSVHTSMSIPRCLLLNHFEYTPYSRRPFLAVICKHTVGVRV